jgi:hypothetical protein
VYDKGICHLVFVTRRCVLKDAVSRKTDRSEHPQAELIRCEAHSGVAWPTGTQKTGDIEVI